MKRQLIGDHFLFLFNILFYFRSSDACMFCKVTIVLGIEMEHMHKEQNVNLPPLGK